MPLTSFPRDPGEKCQIRDRRDLIRYLVRFGLIILYDDIEKK
jgi:hypothetical protein